VVVIAVGVQDPGNLGAIVRVAEAAGASGVIAAGACADPFGWKALRGSMGSSLRLPVAVTADAGEAIGAARRAGYRLVATVPRGGQGLFEVSLSGPIAFLVGGEGPGLPAAVIESADDRITIPMEGAVESLNSAVAAALLVYEAYRQRTS
jgi:RNA methyltransferase, TrmH family